MLLPIGHLNAVENSFELLSVPIILREKGKDINFTNKHNFWLQFMVNFNKHNLLLTVYG